MKFSCSTNNTVCQWSANCGPSALFIELRSTDGCRPLVDKSYSPTLVAWDKT